jgi:hypothetical protein
LQLSPARSSRLKSLSNGGKPEKSRRQTSGGTAKCTALVGRYRKANTMIKSSWSFHTGQCGRSHSSTTAATGIPMYTQKAGLTSGDNPATEKFGPIAWWSQPDMRKPSLPSNAGPSIYPPAQQYPANTSEPLAALTSSSPRRGTL